jgi:hypothetical protein
VTTSLSDKSEGLTPGHVQKSQKGVPTLCQFVHDGTSEIRPNGHVPQTANGIAPSAPPPSDTAEGLTLVLSRTDTAG